MMSSSIEAVINLAEKLEAENRIDDATLLYDHLHVILDNLHVILDNTANVIYRLAQAKSRLGDVLGSLVLLEKASKLDRSLPDIFIRIRDQCAVALSKYNDHIRDKNLKDAGLILDKIVDLLPYSYSITSEALKISSELNDLDKICRYSRQLVKHGVVNTMMMVRYIAACGQTKRFGEQLDAILTLLRHKQNDLGVIHYLQYAYQAITLILCKNPNDNDQSPLPPERRDVLDEVISLCRERVKTQGMLPREDPNYHYFHHKYGCVIKSDIQNTLMGRIPQADPLSPLTYYTSQGQPISPDQVSALANRLEAKVVLMVAADPYYLSQFAARYVKSFFKFCDVTPIILINLIGDQANIEQAVKIVGIDDERLIFSLDDYREDFARAGILDSGALPTSYYQSARFLRLSDVLDLFKRTVIVSDIDTVLQRGIADMVDKFADKDVIFHCSNLLESGMDSWFIANLLMVNYGEGGLAFSNYVKDYIVFSLKSDWHLWMLDQLSFLLAYHHFLNSGNVKMAAFDYYDTNHVMYSYYMDNPYRFFSIFRAVFTPEDLAKFV